MTKQQASSLLPGSKRILVYGQVPPPFHGSNVMTRIFLKSLKELGYETKLFNKMYSKEIREVNKINLKKFLRFLAALGRYPYWLLLFRPKYVVFFISATRIGLLAESLFIFLTNLFKIPFVHYIHANGHREIYSQGGWERMLVRYVFRSAKACLVLGEVFRKDLERFYDNEIYILPNCLLGDLPDKRKRSHPKINVLYLSNLYETKGIMTLMKSIPFVIGKNKNTCFKIAGPWQGSALKKRVFEYVRDQQLSDHIEFLGPIYKKDKENLFSICDIFVFPSYFRFEAFGLVNLEAMQAGIPVITTCIGALPEMVIDGLTGYIIPPKNHVALAEKINVLVENPELRRKMGKAGQKKFAAQYSFSAYNARVKTIMTELLAEKI